MVNRILHTVLIIIANISLTGCIEPYDFPADEKSNSLVVEAAISSHAGPQQVRLTTTRNIYNKDNQYVLFVSGAEVVVTDSNNESFQFLEKGSGYYYSDSSFRAEEGKSYKLKIITREGKVYESAEETAWQPYPLEKVMVSYALKSEKNTEGNFVNVDGFNVKAVVNDLAEQRNFYLLRMRTIYKVLTDPLGFTVFNRELGNYISQPKSCCSICWVSKTLDEFVVYSDQLVNGRENAEIPLVFYPIDQRYFYDKVYFEVTQFSLTQEAYVFWKALYDLKFRQGTLFDPAPSGLPTNIHNIDDETEKVVGYFTVSAVATTGEFITRQDIPRRVIYTYTYKDDCRTLANSTTVQPGFWR